MLLMMFSIGCLLANGIGLVTISEMVPTSPQKRISSHSRQHLVLLLETSTYQRMAENQCVVDMASGLCTLRFGRTSRNYRNWTGSEQSELSSEYMSSIRVVEVIVTIILVGQLIIFTLF
jgi:hypothetical protein